MLIKFSCRNFRSIGASPVVFDLIAAPKLQGHPDHVCTPIAGTRVLRNAAIYGANAAGKSTIILALSFMRAAVVNGSMPQNTTRQYCRASGGLKDEESVFEVQIETGGRAFDYGFSCVLSEYRVCSEWLYELGAEGVCLFSRDEKAHVTLGDEFARKLSEGDRTRFGVYSEDFTFSTANSPALLFLGAVGRGKRYEQGSAFGVFESVYGWFAKDLQIMGAGQPSPTSDFYSDASTLDEVAAVLASFDTGVDRLAKRQIDIEELERHVTFPLAMSIKQLLAQAPGGDGPLRLTARDGNSFVGVERADASELIVTLLEIGHHGSASTFEFGEESDGTRRLFDFMDILFSKNGDALFVVDEIDRSLHPMLTNQLVALFNKVHKNDLCQLAFTTHESSLMSYERFRRDEIWFVDRDDSGTSRLYSLDQFANVRSDAKLSKRYLEGRYGGIPVLSLGGALAAFDSEGV